jgi:hypothetical protein
MGAAWERHGMCELVLRHGTSRPSVAFRYRVVDDAAFRLNVMPPFSGYPERVHVGAEMVGKKGLSDSGKDG